MVLGLTFGAGFAGCSTERKFRRPSPQAGEAGAPPAGATGGTGATGGAKCTSGEVRCEDLIPEKCSEAGDWVALRAACAVACLNGECAACAEAKTTCKDGAVQVCTAGNWVPDHVCAKSCEVDTCVDSCTDGRFQCNGVRSLQKCVGGQYVEDTQCPFSCSVDQCVGSCVPDTKRCNPDALNEAQACNAQGEWDTAACESGTFCVAGDCKPCEPKSVRCSDSGPQLCSDAGEWVNQGACTSPNAACFDGKCVPCTPGDKRCNDDAVEKCRDDGSGWDVAETCSGDTPACLDSSKTCGKCADGQIQCANDQVQTCDDQGSFKATETCEGSTPQCVGNKCAECDPATAERRCETPASAQACAGDGTWALPTDCTGDTPLCRDDLNFVCGCDEGTRRCKSNSVPEMCEGGAWVAQTACTGTADYCLPATGRCVDCAPGKTECQNGIAQTCNEDGGWESLNSCAGPGVNCGNCNLGEACTQQADCKVGFCVQGKCAVCQPGTRECVGQTPRLCQTDGTWQNQTTCSGSTPECLPSSGQCVPCLNGANRTCGNCSTGSQSCANNAWGSCSGAVDLQTSEQYCGNCSTSCSSSQVCEAGACVVDCSGMSGGKTTRCGTSCVNLATDTSNCKSCGTKCTPPASNGSAVCGSSGCDISCNNTRCGTTCCGATPSGSQASCSANTCNFTCSSGNHGCNASTPPCYSDTDATHCGSGCLNCASYAGTTGACSSNACTCEGGSVNFACGASVPTCASWDFNSGTVEGWAYGNYRQSSEHATSGALTTTVINGSPALSTHFDNSTSGRSVAEFEINLCPNGAIINASSYVFSYDVYFRTTSSGRFSEANTENQAYFTDGTSVILSCQPFLQPASDTWNHSECTFMPSAQTNITIVFNIVTAWVGDIFLDNVKFTPE